MAEEEYPDEQPVEEPTPAAQPSEPGAEEGAGEKSLSDDMDLVKGDTAQEKITYVGDQAQKWSQRINKASQAVTSLINPVTGIILLVVIVVVALVVYVSAATQTLGRNSNACKNGEDCSIAEAQTTPNCGNTITLEGTDNISKVFNYLVSKGYSREGAAGIAGNFRAESGAVPWIAEYGYPPASGSAYVVGSDGSGPRGWGIGQWSFGRHIALKEWVIGHIGPEYYKSQYTNGTPPMSREQEDTLLATQLDFMLDGEPAEKANIEAVKNAGSPEDAARVFHDRWERSQGWDPIRAQYAREIYNSAGGGGTGGTPSTPSSCTGGGGELGGVSGDLLNRLKQRAEMVIELSKRYPGGPACVPGFDAQGVFSCPGSGWSHACTAISMMIWGHNIVGSGNGGVRATNGTIPGQTGTAWPPPPGAVVSWNYSGYGHVAIYLGDGDWVDNWGPVGHHTHTQVENGASAHWMLPPESWEGTFLNGGL